MKLEGGIASHVGNVREVNQDRAHFGGCIAAVADGMGGHQGGEIAAQVAVSIFNGLDGPIKSDRLLGLVSEANSAVFDKAVDPDLRGMGTTLVVLALQPDSDQVTIGNVGDSRAYLFRDSALAQITVDHSLVQDLVSAGKITEEEALVHPQRNIVTRALGISPTVEPDSFALPAQVGDRFLLCSDGLFNEVSEEKIAKLLEIDDLEEVAGKLVQAAIDEAGRDNVTVAVVDVVPGAVTADAEEVEEGEAPEVDPASDPTLPMDVEPDAALPAGVDVDDTSGENAVTVDEAQEETVPVGKVPAAAPAPANQVVAESAAVDNDAALTGEEPAALPGPVAETPEAIRSDSKKGKSGLLALFLTVGVLLALAFFLANWYAGGSYYLAAEDGKVAIYKGRPGGFLWFEPELKSPAERDVDSLDEESKKKVEENASAESLEEAMKLRESLVAGVVPEGAESTPETTSPPSSTSSPPTTPADGEPPLDSIPNVGKDDNGSSGSGDIGSGLGA